jgi:hypothetical protein
MGYISVCTEHYCIAQCP